MVAPQLSSRMNWQQRSGQIYANLMEPGLRSIRAIAAARDCQKQRASACATIERRHQYPESPCGNEWLPVVTQIGLGSGVCVRSQAGHWQRDVVRILPYFAFRGRIGVSNAPAEYERKSSSRF